VGTLVGYFVNVKELRTLLKVSLVLFERRERFTLILQDKNSSYAFLLVVGRCQEESITLTLGRTDASCRGLQSNGSINGGAGYFVYYIYVCM
jgi:hypothetical protein